MKKKSLNAKKIIHKKLLRHLADPKVKKIYNIFEKSLITNKYKNNKFLVALSGGPDSLALTYLSKCYSILNNSDVKFVHIDHKLRKTSSIEANELKHQLKEFNINCNILVWKGRKPKSNIQSISRKNRYDLIFKYALKNNFINILIAHHIDDLYENFIIRLIRGSGLKGLVSFDKKKAVDNNGKAVIIRPLLELKKNDLIFLSKKVFQNYFKDPTNKNTTFTRTRIRNLLNELKLEGFDDKKLKQTIKNLSDADDSLRYYKNQNIKLNSSYLKNYNGFILNPNFFKQPHEVVFRSFSYLLKKVGGKYYAARGKKINQILFEIEEGKFKKSTLSGCIMEKVENSLIIYKENRQKK
tara:strand:- start:1537 stop:2598 length:1062 start_codon:yes stop_codon:yes gene_type:complete